MSTQRLLRNLDRNLVRFCKEEVDLRNTGKIRDLVAKRISDRLQCVGVEVSDQCDADDVLSSDPRHLEERQCPATSEVVCRNVNCRVCYLQIESIFPTPTYGGTAAAKGGHGARAFSDPAAHSGLRDGSVESEPLLLC